MRTSLVALLFVLGITSCKKEETPPVVKTISGGMLTMRIMEFWDITDGGDTVSMKQPSIDAFFYADSTKGWTDAGTVKFNNTELRQERDQTSMSFHLYSYPMGSQVSLSGSCDWNVGGYDRIPAVSFSASPMMDFTATLPVDISKAAGFTITLSATNPGDSYRINVESGGKVTKTISGTETSVTFTPEDLAALQELAPGKGMVFINMNKRVDKTVGESVFHFIYDKIYTKTINIHP